MDELDDFISYPIQTLGLPPLEVESGITKWYPSTIRPREGKIVFNHLILFSQSQLMAKIKRSIYQIIGLEIKPAT